MNPPAGVDLLEQRLARVIGQPIPLQLRQSLLIHDGMDGKRGCWFAQCGVLIPCSSQTIETIWRADRKRAAEAKAEGDNWVNDDNWIPAVADAIAEHTIYIDAKDQSVLCYVHAGLFAKDFRYPGYSDFLGAVLKHIKNDALFEWP